jgi:DNA-binding beta-propeller fold protein YncE
MFRSLRLLAAAGVFSLFTVSSLAGAASVPSHQLRLAQLAGSSGCVAQPEDDSVAVGGCGQGKGLIDAASVVLSPDGASVYVAATGSNAVAGFVRDAGNGGLRENYCISGNGTTGIDGTKGACADGDALAGTAHVTVSRDGKFVYATSFWSSGVAILARNTTNGALHQVGCVRGIKTCVSARAMNGARALALSPDGLSAYVAASWADGVSEFKRDPETGLLRPIACISDDGTDRMCSAGNALRGADAILVSPDGKQVYVAAEDSNSVLTFTRDTDTGILTQSGCIMDSAPHGSCATAHGLQGPGALALSPDGRTLYVAAYGSDAISVLGRSTTTGGLRWLGCESEPGTDYDTGKSVADGCGHTRPLTGPTGIALSPDGSRLYVTVASGLTALDRSPTNGTLTMAGCLTYRSYEDDDLSKVCQLATGLDDPSGVAVSRDGRNVYVTSWGSDAITVLAPGPSLSAPKLTAGVFSVRLSCPAERGSDCAGRLVVTPDAPFGALAQSARYQVASGNAGVIHLRLHPDVVRALRRPAVGAIVAATDAQRRLAASKRLFSLHHLWPTKHHR